MLNNIIIPAPQKPNLPISGKDAVYIGFATLFQKSNLFSNLFGLGQGSPDIPDEQTPNSNNNQQTDNQVSNQFNSNRLIAPDAVPDGKGGFIPYPTNFWNGRFSSSLSGMPVMTSITFIGTTYTSLQGKQITIPTITFEMVLIRMKKGRNIEKTEISGRDTGSVKEYISGKDWVITIDCIITASQNVAQDSNGNILGDQYFQEGKYPEENMEYIDMLLNAPIAIEVVCPYINKRVNASNPQGSTYLIIDDDISINQIEGEYEAQRITLNCLTDTPLVLQVAT